MFKLILDHLWAVCCSWMNDCPRPVWSLDLNIYHWPAGMPQVLHVFSPQRLSISLCHSPAMAEQKTLHKEPVVFLLWFSTGGHCRLELTVVPLGIWVEDGKESCSSFTTSIVMLSPWYYILCMKLTYTHSNAISATKRRSRPDHVIRLAWAGVAGAALVFWAIS